MNANILIRRTHLYLGMLLAPWVVMYGVSSAVYNHQTFLRAHFPMAQPEWTQLLVKDYIIELPADNTLFRETGAKILADNGLTGVAFGANRAGSNFNVFLPHFSHPRRLVYDAEHHRLTLEERHFCWYEFLTRQHGRSGFEQPGMMDKAWAVFVDLVCVALLTWIATGLYLWWKLPGTRAAGFVALLGGLSAFAAFALWL